MYVFCINYLSACVVLCVCECVGGNWYSLIVDCVCEHGIEIGYLRLANNVVTSPINITTINSQLFLQ